MSVCVVCVCMKCVHDVCECICVCKVCKCVCVRQGVQLLQGLCECVCVKCANVSVCEVCECVRICVGAHGCCRDWVSLRWEKAGWGAGAAGGVMQG